MHTPPADRSRASASSGEGRASSSGKKVGNGLVALSSAVVVAVYTAGYLRTRPAAARLEAASQRRFPAPVQASLTAVDPAGPASSGRGSQSVIAPPVGSTSLALPTTPMVRKGSETAAVPASAAAAGQPASRVPESAASTSTPGTSVPAAPSTGSADTSAAASVVAAQTGLAQAPAASAAATTASAPASLSGTASGERSLADALAALPPVAQSTPRYKDGTYSGWGSSRHGDIEATIVIDGGRITVSRISMCLTRYSCSWIAPLPPQVLARQSGNVDYVSGATESAIAFYDAIAESLRKAK